MPANTQNEVKPKESAKNLSTIIRSFPNLFNNLPTGILSKNRLQGALITILNIFEWMFLDTFTDLIVNTKIAKTAKIDTIIPPAK